MKHTSLILLITVMLSACVGQKTPRLHMGSYASGQTGGIKIAPPEFDDNAVDILSAILNNFYSNDQYRDLSFGYAIPREGTENKSPRILINELYAPPGIAWNVRDLNCEYYDPESHDLEIGEIGVRVSDYKRNNSQYEVRIVNHGACIGGGLWIVYNATVNNGVVDVKLMELFDP